VSEAVASACAAKCSKVGQKEACKQYAASNCVKECDKLAATLPPKCEKTAIAKSDCEADAFYSCAASVGGTTECGAEKVALTNCVKQHGCVPGEAICDGDRSMRCADDGHTRKLGENCAATKKTCTAGKCEVACKPGEFKCVGKGLYKCLEGGGQKLFVECKGDLLICDDSACRVPAVAPCEPGTRQCGFKGHLQECTPSGKSWKSVDSCEEDSGPCATKLCDKGTSTCKTTVGKAGTSCDDGDTKTTGDVCDGAGGCAGT